MKFSECFLDIKYTDKLQRYSQNSKLKCKKKINENTYIIYDYYYYF